MSELRDVRDRLKGAVITLEGVLANQWEIEQRARVRGKIEGVKLALSYVEDELRVNAR